VVVLRPSREILQYFKLGPEILFLDASQLFAHLTIRLCGPHIFQLNTSQINAFDVFSVWSRKTKYKITAICPAFLSDCCGVRAWMSVHKAQGMAYGLLFRVYAKISA
jgi:hypothetical protein